MWFDMIDLCQVLDYSREKEGEQAPQNVVAYCEQYEIKRPHAHFSSQDGFYFTAKRKSGQLQKGRIYTGLFLQSKRVSAQQIRKVSECSEYYLNRLRIADERRKRKGQ